jgi:Peroxidase, family 2
MFDAIKKVYNLSFPMALLTTFGGYLLCGHRMRTRLDLHDLAKHNRIEHNASLVHQDAKDGDEWAPCPVDHELLEKLLTQGLGGENEGRDASDGITFDDLVEVRKRRLGDMAVNGHAPLSWFHNSMLSGETALVLLTLGDNGRKDGKVDREKLRSWLGEERLPDGWTKNVSGRTIGLKHTDDIANEVKKRLAETVKTK